MVPDCGGKICGFDSCDCGELAIIAAEHRRNMLADIEPCEDGCDCRVCQQFDENCDDDDDDPQ